LQPKNNGKDIIGGWELGGETDKGAAIKGIQRLFTATKRYLRKGKKKL